MMEGERLEALVGFERRVNGLPRVSWRGAENEIIPFPGLRRIISAVASRDGILGAMGTLCFILVLQWMRLDVHL